MEGDVQIKKSPRIADVGEYSSTPPPMSSPLNLEGILGQLCGGSHGGTPLSALSGGVGPQQLILNSLTSPPRSRYGGKVSTIYTAIQTRVFQYIYNITLPL